MKPRHLGLSPGAAKRAPAAVARAYADIEAQLPGLRAASAVTCPTRPGCNACCHSDFPVYVEELAALVPHISAAAWERVRRNASHMVERATGTPCPLLGDDGGCEVYEHRPAVCRAHAVTTAPELCGTPMEIGVVQIAHPAWASMLVARVGALLRRTPTDHLPFYPSLRRLAAYFPGGNRGD